MYDQVVTDRRFLSDSSEKLLSNRILSCSAITIQTVKPKCRLYGSLEFAEVSEPSPSKTTSENCWANLRTKNECLGV